MAPSVYGHEDIKRALALALFGGEPKDPGELYCTSYCGFSTKLCVRLSFKYNEEMRKKFK